MPDHMSFSGLAVSKPLYDQVRDLLLSRISGGEWRVGDLLPNETMLATEYKVSVGTVRRAVEGLEDFGIVTRRQGRGTFVSRLPAAAQLSGHSRLCGPSSEPLVLSYVWQETRWMNATVDDAALLRCPLRTPCSEILRVVQHGDARVGFERTLMPAGLAALIEPKTLAGPGLDLVLAMAGIRISAADETITIATLDAPAADALQLAVETEALLLINRDFGPGNHTVAVRCTLFPTRHPRLGPVTLHRLVVPTHRPG